MAVGAPQVARLQNTVPGQATAGTDSTFTIGRAPKGTVTRVTYTPNADIVGIATNNRTFSLINKLQDGNGAVSIASLTAGNGTNFSDFDEKDLTLSGTPANLKVADGDILAFFSDANGTGMVDPGGLVTVYIDDSSDGHTVVVSATAPEGYIRGVA